MRQRSRIAFSLLLTGLVVSTTVSIAPAEAAPADLAGRAVRGIAPRPGGFRPVVVEDTGWVPSYTSVEAGGGACGGVVTGSPKGENMGTRQQRTVAFRNGDVVNLSRGSVTLAVDMADAGWDPPVPDPAPTDVVVSGPVVRVDYASGAIFLDRKAPGIIAVHTSDSALGPERTAFIKAGMPSVYVLQQGTFTEYLPPLSDAVRILQPASTQVKNVCDVISQSKFRDSTVLVYESQGIGDPIYPS